MPNKTLFLTHQIRQRVKAILALAAMLVGSSVLANNDYWLISEQSSITFLSTKNSSVTEVHQFTTVNGRILADGTAELAISLSSAETGIAIRNERLNKHVFDVGNFPLAMLTIQLPAGFIKQLTIGVPRLFETAATLALHNRSRPLSVKLSATQLVGGNILVTTVQPVVVDAADFALTDGLATLQGLARLASIATTVPVTAHLLFEIDTVSR